jgi:SAM-dependent methyltransferase
MFFPNICEVLRGKKVLDIGCGSGGLVKSLRNRGVDAYGVNLFMKTELPFLFSGDFMDFPENAKFDALLAMGVFEDMAIYRPFAWSSTKDYGQLRKRKFEQWAKRSNAKDPVHVLPDWGDLKPSPEAQATMIKKLRRLVSDDGLCLFYTYTSSLIFSKASMRRNGFSVHVVTCEPYEIDRFTNRRKREGKHQIYLLLPKKQHGGIR